MFSAELNAYARKAYTQALPTFGSLRQTIHEEILGLEGGRRTLMELAYGTLPCSDVGAVAVKTILSYVDHALFLRKTFDHVAVLPESLFLHHVFYPRVGTEALVDCRAFFYGETKDILTLPEEERILAVNRWCAAQMTYQSADDRTENPLTAYFSGNGRCGEESVFAVSVLRSLGIPARQVYAPWWSHCDDNHAWVEVWQKGQWHFLGACEIEPVLNRGWFISAATRAPLVHSRTFFHYGGDETREELIGLDGACRYYNQTHRYAQTGKLRLRVTDEEGVPCSQAEVSFGVINMAAERTIARVITDEDGIARLTVGCGTLLVRARHRGKEDSLTLCAQPGQVTEAKLVCRLGIPKAGETDLGFYAPCPTTKNTCPITPEQQLEKRQAIIQANHRRTERISGYIGALANRYPPELQEMMHLAGANGGELLRFYDPQPESLKPLALDFLRSLAKKDYKDASCRVLQGHFDDARILPVSFDDQFVPYVMCPRIGWEELENWREAVRKAISPSQRDDFMENPPQLMAYLLGKYLRPLARYHRELTMTPGTVLRLGYGDLQGVRLLFVAILRTLGIPSRLSPRDGSAQYYRDGQFHSAEGDGQPEATLTFQPEPGTSWVYAVNYTLSRREKCGYTLLTIGEGELADPISLPPGQYRLITTNRLPNGNGLVRTVDFTLSPGEKKTIPLTLRTASPEEMLANNTLPTIALFDGGGNPLSVGRTHLLAWLDIGTEPTEHILNELLGSAEKRNALALPVVLVLQSRADLRHQTLQKVLGKLPRSTAAFGDFDETPETVARAMYLEPGQWPLVVLTDGRGQGRYGHCGYGVGIVELALKLAEAIPE